MPAAIKKSNIHDWKRLWQMVSGIHFETPQETVGEELLRISSELQDGVLQFKPKSASNVQLASLLKEKKQEKLLPFTETLQEMLNLESNQCWDLLCYYLTKEYRGSSSLLTQLISTETNMTKLLEDIRHYYSLERMIVLKIMKNILVFYEVPNHPYQKQYFEIVEKLTLEKLRNSYLDQLESLMNELPPRKLMAGECFHSSDRLINWSERNARETNEVFHILLLLSEHLPMGLKEIRRLFSAFKQHSFGRNYNNLNEANLYHQDLIKSLTYSEQMLLLKSFDALEHLPSDEIEQFIAELNVDIASLHHKLEHSPLLLAWMLLRLRLTNDADDPASLLFCRQLGKCAVDLKCFIQMLAILKHPMFSDDSLLSRIVRKTIYNQLGYLCDLFDGDGSCSQYEGIYDLLCELLSWPQLAKEFCNREDEGVRSLYSSLIENFPLEFTHLAKLALALTKAGQGSYIKNQLESLPILAVIYDEREHRLRELGPDEYELTASVKPFPHIDYVIPAGTTCTAVQHPSSCYMHIRTQVNFFHALHHEINCLLKETPHLNGEFESSERIKRVEAGLFYLEAAVQRIKAIDGISSQMVHPTEMCIDLLNKFKSLQYPPARLMASCLNVCTALLHLVDEEIFTRVRHLGILPSISGTSGTDILNDYKLYASGSEVCFESRFLGSIIDNVEKKNERYDFLLAYLHFLRTYTKLKRNRYTQVEIPGLIFLLRDVFPHLHAWHFEKQEDKNRLYFEVLSFICDILDLIGSSSTSGNTVAADLLLKVCVYSLLNLENGLVLLRFVGVGNAFVQYSMELETNWMQQQPHGLMMLVRLSMRILMQLLRMKESVYGKTGEHQNLSPLEALIYTQPKQRDTLRIIPTVCSYMSNIFDRWLPILSCRLLKRIALEFNMSLLACLDMEADQIRLTFMQKMPDDLESDAIKIAILELVDACIAKQPGVTEAFFKVNYKEDKRAQSFFGKEILGKSTPNIGESIVTYMREFLDALEMEPLTIQQMLPSKIMNIFHSLWKNNLQMLVDDLTKEKAFWDKLCSPLFSELQPNLRIYTQLINMVSIEIYTGDDKNGSLKKVLEKFFEMKCFEKWLDYVFLMPKEPAKQLSSSSSDELPDWICCLQSFKDLIIILLKKQPRFMIIPEPQFKLLARKCLSVLVDRAHYLDDMRPFIMLAELYVFILLKFNHSYTNTSQDEEDLMENLLQLMNSICSSYEDLHVRAKEACLAIITKCAHLHTNLLIKDTSIALRFLNSVVSIICMELQHMENSVSLDKSPTDTEISHNSLILCLNLLKAVATIFHSDGPGNWDLPFVSVRLFQRLMRCISHTLPLHSKQVLSAQLLDVLIVFAKSHCSVEFLHCDVGECLWLNLLPPRELLQSLKNEFTKPPGTDNPPSWTVEEWWPIYARGIELVNIIYDKHKKSFLSEVLQFVGIHEFFLVESLLLVKQSLEPAAMQLIKAAITLVASLTEHQKEWRADHQSSLANIMRAVKGLLCHSSSLFHQQRNLRCLLAGRRSQLEILRSTETICIDDEIITACNDLTYIIIYCVKSLQQFSPDLLDLLCSPIYEPHKWDLILDITFGASKLNDQNISLTFGMLLNMVSIFVKALNMQNHGFNGAPLNKLNNLDIGQLAEQTDSSSSTIDAPINQSSRTFSKNLSTNSISSVACPSSELLSNLDSQLCLVALEHLLMFVASQGIYMIRLPDLEPRWKQIIRRDVNSELLSYHEFVRRKVIADYRDSRCQCVRRKHGLLKIKFHDPARSVAAPSRHTDVVRRVSSSNLNELRVNVVRRQHLQHQQRSNFEMTRMLSPIGAGPQSSQQVAASTPSLEALAPRKRLYAEAGGEYATEDESSTDLELYYFNLNNEPGFCELSQVQLVEEDYLQLMSNLFSVIPQSD